MSKSKKKLTVWQQILRVLAVIALVIRNIIAAIGHFFKIIWDYCFRFRKIILAIPVVVAGVSLASYCRERMPENVGIGLEESGQYATTISRDLAVLGPLAITFFCLLLMFCSRKTLYPWLISVFSLILPILIMLTNIVFLPF